MVVVFIQFNFVLESLTTVLLHSQVAKSVTDASQLGTLGASLSHQFSALASDSAGAIRQTANVEVANRLRSRWDIFAS